MTPGGPDVDRDPSRRRAGGAPGGFGGGEARLAGAAGDRGSAAGAGTSGPERLLGSDGESVAKPVPEPSELAAPYWEAARAGRLEIQRCRACRRWIHFPDVRCPSCLATDLGFEPVGGRGVVGAYTVVHRSFVPGFGADGPYAVGWIDLEEQAGLRVFADLVDIAPEDVSIGLPVEVTFTERPGWGLIPSFRPRSGA